ncbi:MAG: hypothetical protein ACYTG2_15205 [Planctomycetota bacterium]
MLRLALSVFVVLSVFGTASAQECADLTIEFTGSQSEGGTLSIVVDSARPDALVLLAIGDRLGETCVDLGPFGGFCLGIEDAFVLVPVGATDASGHMGLAVDIPPVPHWSGSGGVEFLTVQAVLMTGLDPGFWGGFPMLEFCTSDVEGLRVSEG